ncbi:hypothetical protein JCM33374_g2669 [Metschnikowia sp. JCM 33374]|nr:hypothetical protein JCM33374_g2669 [Metschnikowia sp. JCM 33374]
MAFVAHVLTDLSALSGETKRKNQDVRSAIENAHVLAKKLPATAQLSQSTEVQTVFCAPFLLALESPNAKLAAAALPPLLRLASSRSLGDSHPTTIVDTLYKIDPATVPVETQLKVLQLLPALAQNHSFESAAFVRLTAVASRLAGSSNVVVANTASATLQQVFSSLFDRLRGHQPASDAPRSDFSVSPANPATNQPASTFSLDDLEARCCHVIMDLTNAFLGGKLDFFADKDIRFRPEAALEILENVLALNRDVFEARRELSAVLKLKTVPGLLNVLHSTSPQYPLVIRTLRIASLLISYQISDLTDECELLLASTNHILLDDSTVSTSADETIANHFLTHPYWEKSLVIESYRSILSNFDVVSNLFGAFDANKQHKSVLREVFTVMDSFLSSGYVSLFKNDIISIPDEKSSVPLLAKATAALKTPMMDHLDRSEPPSTIPELYAPFLILRALLGFTEGVSGFVFNISTNASAETIENDVDFITSLNESVFSEVHSLFKKFLYCSSDSDSFHMVVRALQKYTHAIGLLGLSAFRDDLLVMLSACIIKNCPSEEEKKGNSSNLLALGESLVESISSTIQPPFVSSPIQNSDRKFSVGSVTGSSSLVKQSVSRNFNSRQVICLRAFSNLAISLGSTLQDSWRVVWQTLQWVNYFLEGPDEYGSISQSKDPKNPTETKLSAHDLAGIRASRDKLLESLSEYQYEPFFEAFSVLTELYNEGEKDLFDKDGNFEKDESKTDELPIEVCPFNKSYFLKMIMLLSKLDFKTFAFIDEDIWGFTSEFFERSATNRALAHQKRIHLVNCYTSIIDSVTRKGFKEEAATEICANKSLDALFGFLQKLLQLGRAQELLIMSCETEMHLIVLKTLHSLIDDYDSYYQNSWDLVFKILITAFVNTEDQSVQGTKLVEKIVMLISTSFDSLKMILDEFLATLPFNQLKSLIDTLLKFCSQKYDLNISFSSVSYFWLISDCIHSNMTKDNGVDTDSLKSIGDMHQLEGLLQNATSGSPELYQALNIYLLAKLSHLCTDERNQVREGAIQTLFQILDVQGNDKQSWELIYHIVFPELLDVSRLDAQSASFSKKDMISSLNLVLSGLVSVYAKFMMDFENYEDIHFKFWKRFIDYMSTMLRLRWNELNLTVFQSFQDVLLSLRGVKSVPKPITTLLFDFWVSVPIDYDFVKPEYQESLALFNESFKDLYNLVRDDFNLAETNQVLNVLNKCARYPVLKPGVTDSTKPSKLQKIVVENLTFIDKKGEGEEISAAVIQQMAQISAYPFEIRGRIEAKLKSKFEGKLKIPTFVAIGQLAFEAVSAKLAEVTDLKVLLKDDHFHRTMRDLLVIVRNEAHGVTSENSDRLWVRCNELILQVTSRLVHQNLKDFEQDRGVWEVLLECITVIFEKNHDEKADLQQYKSLSEVILPVFFQSGQDELIKTFVQKIYFNSYLYKANATENELMNGGDEYEALTNYVFEDSFGTTAKVEVEENREIRMKCLKELFRISSVGGTSAKFAKEYVVIRAAFAIRRFIADGRLSGHRPLPQIQEDELLEILRGFTKIGQDLEIENMRGIMKLLTQSVVYADRIEGMKNSIQEVLQVGLK